MKKILLILAVVCAALAGCEKKGPTGSGNNGGGDNTGGGNNDGGNTGGGNTPAELVVNLEVVNIDNNQATIRVSLVSGEAYGGKIVLDAIDEEVTINRDSDIQLTRYIKENGIDFANLPYETTITDIRLGKDRFTAVGVYGKDGVMAATAYKTWTPVGLADGWSTDNNPGELGEIEW